MINRVFKRTENEFGEVFWRSWSSQEEWSMCNDRLAELFDIPEGVEKITLHMGKEQFEGAYQVVFMRRFLGVQKDGNPRVVDSAYTTDKDAVYEVSVYDWFISMAERIWPPDEGKTVYQTPWRPIWWGISYEEEA